MVKHRVFGLFVVVSGLLSAQSDLLVSGSKQPRQLLLSIYAQLYSQPQPLPAFQSSSFRLIDDLRLTDTDALTNTLIYLNDYYRTMPQPQHAVMNKSRLSEIINSKGMPHYPDGRISQHIVELYRWSNLNLTDIFDVAPSHDAVFASFLTIADRVDGKFDTRMELPNLTRFYHMLVTRAVPLPAICYNCREDEGWTDRRSLIRTDKLERELPRSLKKMKPKLTDEEKLARIGRFIRSRVMPSDDGWETDYWQTPMETLLVEEGDCEDFAILYQAVAEYFAIKTQVVVGQIVVRGEDGLETQGHAWVEYKGRVIDPILEGRSEAWKYAAHFRFSSTVAVMALPMNTPDFKQRFAINDPN